LAGLFLSYYVNVAPGGFTAVVSVVVLLIVIIIKRGRYFIAYKIGGRA